MPGEPRILASFLHGTLEAIDAMGGDLGERVRAALKPETLEEIENAWSASWLPISHDVELTVAFFELAGEERTCEAMRANLANTFDKPILAPMIDAAVRILGLSPGRILSWAPRAWSLLFRDLGELSVESGTGCATVWIEGLPAEVAEERRYLLGTASALSAVFDLVAVRGTCRLVEHGAGRARFELHWQPD